MSLFVKNGVPLKFYVPKPTESNVAKYTRVLQTIKSGGGKLVNQVADDVICLSLVNISVPKNAREQFSSDFVTESLDRGKLMVRIEGKG
jgi:hypothetical protein